MRSAFWLPCSLASLLLLLPSVHAQAERPAPRDPDVIFVPTPDDVVSEMLEMARVGKTDVL